MEFKLWKIYKIVFLLFIIWAVSNFFNIYLSLPFWLLLVFSGKYSNFEYVSILICTELFNKIDTLTFGPISIVQILAVFILIRVLAQSKRYMFLLIRRRIVLILIFILFYFTYSYYSYFGGITLSVINWVFIIVLTIFSFKGSKKEVLFFSWLFVLSVFVIALETFIAQLIFYPDIKAARPYSVGNSNSIGFYVLNALIFIIFLLFNSSKKHAKAVKRVLYFFVIYLIFSGGRLNLVILLLLFLILIANPIKDFWLSRKKMIKILVLGVLAVLVFGGVKNFIFRKDNASTIQSVEINSVSDLKDKRLGAFTSGRGLIYFNAIELIKLKPIFGNGFLSWNDINNKHNTWIASGGKSRISLHSAILQYLAETGIIGFGLYLLYLLNIYFVGRKLSRSANSEYYLLGRLICFIVILLFLGGTLDNHSLSSGLIHFVAGIGILLNFKNIYEKKYSVLYQ